MKFFSTQHVHRVAPPVLGNAESDQPCIIGLRVISSPEHDKHVNEQKMIVSEYATEKATELITKATYDLVKSHVASIENLEIDGQQITDFDTFYEKAPPELVSWVFKAVFSSYLLTAHAVKN